MGAPEGTPLHFLLYLFPMSDTTIYPQDDTIAAIATPLGEGGLGIVRLSGKMAIEVAERLFQGKHNLLAAPSHTAHFGRIVDPKTGAIADEIVATVFREPHSYTGENLVELSCHGGPLVTSKVLSIALENDSRLANPGEFTLRAFLNGRIDLTQAEAVVDIIRAKTDLSLQAGIEQLSGKLSHVVNALREQLLDLLAHLEAAIDFPEEEIETKTASQLLGQLGEIQTKIKTLLATYEEGRILRDGLSVVIAGRPNVGKSSLLNALLKEERAIVTPYAGTTRDVIKEYANFHGVPVKLVDTAGLRPKGGKIEREGIRRTEKEIEKSDLILFVCDAQAGFGPRDRHLWQKLPEGNRLAVINKIDLVSPKEIARAKTQLNDNNPISEVSALYGTGVEELKKTIAALALPTKKDTAGEVVVTNFRHKEALEKARTGLARVEEGLQKKRGFELVAFDLRQATDHLGEIVGKIYTENILGRIFSTFCIGK